MAGHRFGFMECSVQPPLWLLWSENIQSGVQPPHSKSSEPGHALFTQVTQHIQSADDADKDTGAVHDEEAVDLQRQHLLHD